MGSEPKVSVSRVGDERKTRILVAFHYGDGYVGELIYYVDADRRTESKLVDDLKAKHLLEIKKAIAEMKL